MITVIRAAIDGRSLSLVISANPFSDIQYPKAAAPVAHLQRYTMRDNGALFLESDSPYALESTAAAAFDRIHPQGE